MSEKAPKTNSYEGSAEKRQSLTEQGTSYKEALETPNALLDAKLAETKSKPEESRISISEALDDDGNFDSAKAREALRNAGMSYKDAYEIPNSLLRGQFGSTKVDKAPEESEKSDKNPETQSPAEKDLSGLTDEELSALDKDAQDAQKRVDEERQRRAEAKNPDNNPPHYDTWLNLDDDLDSPENPESPRGTDIVPHEPTSPEVPPADGGNGGNGNTPPSEAPNNPEDRDKRASIEVNHKLLTDLGAARERYANLTAKDRQSFIGRFFKKETRLGNFLKKIPGVEKVADSLNERQGKEIEAAIAEYKSTVDKVIEQLVTISEAQGATPEQIEHLKRAELINQNAFLEKAIQENRENLAKDAGFWTNQWVNGGKLKKAGIVLAAGAAAGAIVATGGAALGIGSIFGMSSGALAGGLAGGKVAHGVTRRRAKAIFKEGNKEGGEAGLTVAEHQANVDRENKDTALNQEGASVGDIVEGTEQSSDEEMYRNRKRVRTARALGAAAGGASGFAARAAFEGIFGGSKSATVEAVSPDAKPPKEVVDAPKPKVVDNVGEATHSTKEILKGNSFNVEYGNGFSHEWVDWAQANGKNLSIEDAYKLHEAVRGKFGDAGIINKLGTYTQNGDLRIASPGNTSWDPGVAKFAQSWLEARGKW